MEFRSPFASSSATTRQRREDDNRFNLYITNAAFPIFTTTFPGENSMSIDYQILLHIVNIF